MKNSNALQQEAAKELLIRRRARADILRYVNAIDVPGRPVSDDEGAEFLPIETSVAVHHRLMLTALDRIAATPHGRLMLFMPPGSAKSTYGSVVFPSRFLGQAPGRKLILASYGDDLARKHGRRTRQLCRQPRFKGIWGCELTADVRAADEWTLTNGSEYMSCGILSGITGNRAHGIVIDDPIKGRRDANSEAIRNSVWNAYQDDLLTRLIPGGWLVLIQTRWHEDDLAGRILPESWKGQSGDILCRDGNVWHVICLQARCEVDSDPLGRQRGEYLWPEWFDRKHWAQFEAAPMTWASLFQQLPAPAEGGIFKPDAIHVDDYLPVVVEWIRAWDLAASKDEGDWTVGGLLGKTDNGRYLIGDVVRFRGAPHEVVQGIKATAQRDGTGVRISLPQDPGQAGKSQVAYLTGQLAGYMVSSSPESGDKITRAEPFASQVNVGNVSMLRGEWNNALIGEMRNFPNGTHDDQVDALARAFNELIGNGTWAFGSL